MEILSTLWQFRREIRKSDTMTSFERDFPYLNKLDQILGIIISLFAWHCQVVRLFFWWKYFNIYLWHNLSAECCTLHLVISQLNVTIRWILIWALQVNVWKSQSPFYEREEAAKYVDEVFDHQTKSFTFHNNITYGTHIDSHSVVIASLYSTRCIVTRKLLPSDSHSLKHMHRQTDSHATSKDFYFYAQATATTITAIHTPCLVYFDVLNLNWIKL